jgi:cobalt/nickel transport system permease protein
MALQLGAFAVVLETVASGRTALPFRTFALFMQPIHLVIGLVEGAVTLALVSFLQTARPEMFPGESARPVSLRGVRLLALLALLTGGVFSWWASKKPDGLEWAISRVTGHRELQAPGTLVHGRLARAQEATRLDGVLEGETSRAGTSLSGVLGGGLTLALVALAGLLLRGPRRAA